MQENVERQLGNQIWHQMNSGSYCLAPGRRFSIETRWMQEVVEGHRGGILDIETRWTQEVCGEARAGGRYRYSNHMSAKIISPDEDACKKLWRDEGEKRRYWNRMSAGSCWEAQVWESFRILKRDACKKLLGGHGGPTYETRWKQEVLGAPGGSLDVETGWMQEAAERLGGSIDIETQWMQEM